MNVNNGQFFGDMDKIPFFVMKVEYLYICYTGKPFWICFILFGSKIRTFLDPLYVSRNGSILVNP